MQPLSPIPPADGRPLMQERMPLHTGTGRRHGMAAAMRPGTGGTGGNQDHIRFAMEGLSPPLLRSVWRWRWSTCCSGTENRRAVQLILKTSPVRSAPMHPSHAPSSLPDTELDVQGIAAMPASGSKP